MSVVITIFTPAKIFKAIKCWCFDIEQHDSFQPSVQMLHEKANEKGKASGVKANLIFIHSEHSVLSDYQQTLRNHAYGETSPC